MLKKGLLLLGLCFIGCLNTNPVFLLNAEEPNLSFVSKEIMAINDSVATISLVVKGRTQAGYFVDVETRNMGEVFPRMIFLASRGTTEINFTLPVKVPGSNSKES